MMTNTGGTTSSEQRVNEGVRRLRHRVAAVAGVFAVFAAIATLPAAAPAVASSTQIPITSVAGFPNGRTFSGDLLPNAIDGNINTFTWTTNPNNIATPSHLAIGFASSPVDRLRLWKEAYGG